MPCSFSFTRLENGRKTRTTRLAEALRISDIQQDRWLFVSPHDDDACMGGGLWMQAAIEAGADVSLLVVTDGRMGYCSLEQKHTIVETRKHETWESCQLLGMDKSRVHYINYPDCSLNMLQGRRAAQPGERHLYDHVGLQNAMTWFLRQLRPHRIIVPTPTDLHPDHKLTYSEMMISLFHATGEIWPELGPRLSAVPAVYEMAIYCDFSQPPNLQVKADEAAFERKLGSIAAYRSQAQIVQLVEQVKKAGPYEYLREVNFQFYNSATYHPMFE